MLKHIISAAWLGLEYGCYPLLVFLTTPYFINTLGIEGYGHWMLLNSFVGLGVILSAGTSVALIKQMSDNVGRSAHNDIQNTFRSSLTIAMCGGVILSTVLFLVLNIYGLELFANIRSKSALVNIAAAAAILIWIDQIDSAASSALKGSELYGISASTEIITKSLQIGAAAFTLSCTSSLNALYVSLVAAALLRILIKLEVIRKKLNIENITPNFNEVGSLLSMARWGWFQGVGAVLFGISDRFMVGSILGASSLAYYSLASQIAQQIHGLTAAVLSSLFPLVSRRLAANINYSLKKIFKISIVACLLFALIIVSFITFAGDLILEIWLGKETAAFVSPVLTALTISYGVLLLNIVPNYFLLGMGKVREVAFVNLISGCVMLFFMLILEKSNGLYGIAIARVSYGVVSTIALLVIFKYYDSKRGLIGRI